MLQDTHDFQIHLPLRGEVFFYPRNNHFEAEVQVEYSDAPRVGDFNLPVSTLSNIKAYKET